MTWSGSKSDRAVAHYWRDLRRYSDLYGVLVWRDPSIRYKETIFGFLWALARPFLTMLALILGFASATLARRRSEDSGATVEPADVAPEPVPDASIKQRPALATAYFAPSGLEKEKLSTVWSGIDHDFFDLGGHSLLAMRMEARIQEPFVAQLALRDVFDAPTIHRLVERIGTAAPDATLAAAVEDAEEMIF